MKATVQLKLLASINSSSTEY